MLGPSRWDGCLDASQCDAGFTDLAPRIQYVPGSHVRTGIRNAIELAPEASVETAVGRLGNGSAVSAPDTVPFALWCAARHLGSYEAALWATVSGLRVVNAMVGRLLLQEHAP